MIWIMNAVGVSIKSSNENKLNKYSNLKAIVRKISGKNK